MSELWNEKSSMNQESVGDFERRYHTCGIGSGKRGSEVEDRRRRLERNATRNRGCSMEADEIIRAIGLLKFANILEP